VYYWVSKTLQEFAWPLSVGLLALGWAAYQANRRGNRRQFALTLLAFFYLAVCSLPAVAFWLRSPLEDAVPGRAVDDYPKAQAILVLGGSATRREPPRFEAEEIRGGRLLAAARLYRLGKAPVIVVTGGNPYKGRAEAEDMREVLVAMGVPEGAIWLESRARNTDVLLVTSALHMRRSLALFAGTGLKITPVPTSRETAEAGLGWASFIPSAVALSSSSYSLKEYLGHWVGKF